MRVRIGDVVGVLVSPPDTSMPDKPSYDVRLCIVSYVHGLGTIPCEVDLEMIGAGGLLRATPYQALDKNTKEGTWHVLPRPDHERVPA